MRSFLPTRVSSVSLGNRRKFLLESLALSSGIFGFSNRLARGDESRSWKKEEDNALQARNALQHCYRYVHGWLAQADEKTGLIPRNLEDSPYWNARDAAADNYPFMVLTSALTDRTLYEGRMREMLRTERKLTRRVGNLPDDFLFATQAFRTAEVDLPVIIFGASEYVKDGLLPLTEWLGKSPWSERMLELLDGILEESHLKTPVGVLPATDHEVCGELLQSFCRCYWMTKREPYRTMAFRIADYFFLHHLPTKQKRLRLSDHGCEVIGGLSEAYYLAAHTDSNRRDSWQPAMHQMLDRILEVGRDEFGFFYSKVNPVTGKILRPGLTDNWGYNYNAFLTVAQLEGVERYHEAVQFVLSNLEQRKDYRWQNGSADGYADSIEGALNLLNRIPLDVGFNWVDYSADIMLKKQREDGIIEGWHGDGNYARTAILYALWKSKGLSIQPWRDDVFLGAEQVSDGSLRLAIRAKKPWAGRVLCDIPRHQAHLNIPTDYPRLNQFPEWFTVEEEASYSVTSIGQKKSFSMTGRQLHQGLPLQLTNSQWNHLTIRPAGTQN